MDILILMAFQEIFNEPGKSVFIDQILNILNVDTKAEALEQIKALFSLKIN